MGIVISYVCDQANEKGSKAKFKLYFSTCMHCTHHQLHAGVLVLQCN